MARAPSSHPSAVTARNPFDRDAIAVRDVPRAGDLATRTATTSASEDESGSVGMTVF